MLLAACTSSEESSEGTWFALHANSVRELPARSLLPMGRLRPDGSWDLPWPRSFGVSYGVAEQASLVPIDADGFLLPPRDRTNGTVRPGVHWLLPYEFADSARPRSIAPVRWFRYTAGEEVQGRSVQANALVHTDDYGCGFWVLVGGEQAEGGVPQAMALSRPALRALEEDEFPGLGEMLTAAGFPHEPSESDGGYYFPGDNRHPAGQYPRRTVVGLARVEDDLDIALVSYEQAGPGFGGHVTTWALVALQGGRASVVSRFSRWDTPQCTRPPPENRGEAPVWVGLLSQEGSQLEPIGRRHPDGSWDLPWPDWIEGARLDSSGYLRRWGDRSDASRSSDDGWPLPFRTVAGGRVRVDVPLQWYRMGHGRAVPGTVTHVMLAGRHCLAGWSLRMDPAWNMSGLAGREVAVAFNQPLAVQLAEEDIPDLDSILARLGLLDRPDPDRGGYQMAGSSYPRRDIIGLFRVGDIIIGVVGEYHYEGQATIVFEISGGTASIVSEASGGGC